MRNLLFYAGDVRTQGAEPALDVLVTAVDLLDVVDAAGADGAEGGDEQRDAGPDVGRGHRAAPEVTGVVVADDHGAVRVAENDLRAHIDQVVHEEQTAFKHLLVNQHGALRLGGDHEHHADQVGGQAGPGGVGDRHNGAVQIGVDAILLLGRDKDVVAPLLKMDAQPAETLRDDAQMIVGDILDGERAAGHRGHCDEGADFDHIGQDRVLRAVKFLYPFDGQQVGTDAADARPHRNQQLAELLQVGFAGGVVDDGRPLGQYGGHHDVGRTGYRGFVEQHPTPFQARRLQLVGGRLLAVDEFGAQALHPLEVGVEPPAADLVAAGLGGLCPAESGEQGTDEHNRAAQGLVAAQVVLAVEIVLVDGVRRKGVSALLQRTDRDAHFAEHGNQVVDVQNVRNVADDDHLAGEQCGAENLQGLILGALGPYLPGKGMSAFYDKRSHRCISRGLSPKVSDFLRLPYFAWARRLSA